MLTTTLPPAPLKAPQVIRKVRSSLDSRLLAAERMLEVQFTRIAQLQAQVDVLLARARGGSRGERG